MGKALHESSVGRALAFAKATRFWICLFGLMIVAVAAYVRLRSADDQVTVLLRGLKGAPLTNSLVKIRISKVHRIPVISSLPGVPQSWSTFTLAREQDCPGDGLLRVPRVSGHGVLEKVEITIIDGRPDGQKPTESLGPVFTKDTRIAEEGPLSFWFSSWRDPDYTGPLGSRIIIGDLEKMGTVGVSGQPQSR